MRKLITMVAVLSVAFLFSSCSCAKPIVQDEPLRKEEPTESVTMQVTVEPTPTVEPTKELTPTVEPTVESTPTVEPTKEPTPTVEPTKEATPVVTEAPKPTPKPTEVPTPTAEPTKEPTPVVTEAPKPTPKPTETPTPTVEPTKEPTPVVTEAPKPPTKPVNGNVVMSAGVFEEKCTSVADYSLSYSENRRRLNENTYENFGVMVDRNLFTRDGVTSNFASLIVKDGIFGIQIYGWRGDYDSSTATNVVLNSILEAMRFYTGDKEVALALWSFLDKRTITGYADTLDFGFEDVRRTENGYVIRMNGQEIEVENFKKVTTVYFLR